MFALDATKLFLKVFEKGLDLEIARDLCEKMYSSGQVTIAEAIALKEFLNLTDSEAIDIFLV